MPVSSTDLILNPDGSVYHLNLLPEHLSDTIITVGDPERVRQVTKHFDKIESRMQKREFITEVGYIGHNRITVISTGIGTDNVEIVLTELDALANIDLATRELKKDLRKLNIIRIGTSGTFQNDIPVGSHLASVYGVGLDNLMNFYKVPTDGVESEIADSLKEHIGLNFRPYVFRGSLSLNERFGRHMIQGNTLTCPGFYGPQGRRLRAEIAFPELITKAGSFRAKSGSFVLTNFEMETAGYYGMGRLLGHEILSVNAIIANRVKNEFAADPGAVTDSLIEKILTNI